MGDGVVWPQRFKQQVHEEHEDVPSNEAEGRRNSTIGKSNVQDVISPKQPKPNKFQSEASQNSQVTQSQQQESIKSQLQIYQTNKHTQQRDIPERTKGQLQQVQLQSKSSQFYQQLNQNQVSKSQQQIVHQQQNSLKDSGKQLFTQQEIMHAQQVYKTGETIVSTKETPKKPDVSNEPLQNKKKQK